MGWFMLMISCSIISWVRDEEVLYNIQENFCFAKCTKAGRAKLETFALVM